MSNVSDLTSWCAYMVVVSKKKGVRISVELKSLNEVDPIPRVEEILAQISDVR